MTSTTEHRTDDPDSALEPIADPEVREGDLRLASLTFTIKDHKGFEKRLNCISANVKSHSRVFVSICEEVNGQPVQGAATMMVHNITPHDDGIVIVRGEIGWETDIFARLSVIVAP